MNILYNISLHVIYAKIIPNVVHDITSMFIAITVIVTFYYKARLFITSCLKADNTTIDNKQNKIQNDYMWTYETKEIPIEKEENKDGKTELESDACD